MSYASLLKLISVILPVREPLPVWDAVIIDAVARDPV
jgi:hypothetical protein